MLVFDSGNALFKFPGAADAQSTERAKFILQKMGALQTKAFVVGQRDLNAGAVWLAREAKASGVTALSANLVGPDDKPLFAPSTIVDVDGTKIAFIGITAPGNYGEATARPILPAARNELLKLKGKANITIVLAATSFADALQLSNELKGQIDFVAQSGEVRGMGIAQKGPGNFVLPSGERGRAVGRLDLTLSAPTGPFGDLSEQERAAQIVQIITRQLDEVQKRKAAAKDAAVKAELDKTAKDFETRKKQAEADMKAAKASRAFKLSFVGLGSDVIDDPEWQKEIDRIDPPAQRGH
ncbi:MAG: 5'-nucleotidase [Myxococcaceae bacterium]